jgi:putative transposase
MSRTLNKGGYLRFRHWRLYGELGLAKRKASIWLSKEHLTVEFGDEPLSQYAVKYQPDEKHLRDIVEPRRFETRYRSPQLELWQSGEVEWHLVRRLADYAPRRRQRMGGAVVQQPLFAEDASQT